MQNDHDDIPPPSEENKGEVDLDDILAQVDLQDRSERGTFLRHLTENT